jgi:branched-chain amino acid aminotransferase
VQHEGQPGRGRDHELAVGELPRRRERRHGHSRKISSWKRIGANTIPHVAKATGIYLNSMLAVHEAQNAGYDEAILLTDDGFVADGSGENIFVVKDGKIWTPPLSTSILPGITRDSVIQMAQDLGYVVEEAASFAPTSISPRRSS